jgi:2-polyprenyl-6-methoxyphenol hydroxylase-like FAD-dependent oxidoreductase
MPVSKIDINNEQLKVDDNLTCAIVIGSGIAGLVTTQVLTKHFDQVIVIERDAYGELCLRYTEKPTSRQGVPQSHQVHVLLTQGQIILEGIFPGLKAELADKGSPLIDWTADCPLLLPGGWSPRLASGITTRACSRNMLESLLHQRVANNGAVKFLEKTQVTGLLSNSSHTTITGVQIKDANGKKAELHAQLVVDASGRSSKTPQWLQTLGYEKPKETVINSFLGYATRLYQSLSSYTINCKALYLMPQAPHHTRGGSLYQVEGDRWMVCLVGVGRDYPPTDEAGFLEFAQSLVSPVVYEAIKNGQPISPVYGYQRTENRWCHYEKLAKFPENFVVLGDAVCAFNPVYGQGMTIAAMGALMLDKCLQKQNQWRSHKDLTGLARRFQKHLAKVNEVPWMMATSDDFRWPTTEGGKPNLITRLMHGYLNQVMQTASNNPQVYQVFLEVIHLLKSPTAFFHPSIMMQVLLHRKSALQQPNSQIVLSDLQINI